MNSIQGEDPLKRVAIVVPVGPGDRAWSPLRDALRAHAAAAEILWVFADDDAQTRTGDVLSEMPGEVLFAPRGRASQQNVGAASSSRPWLCFLHADSRPGAEAFAAMRAFVACDAPALGWFRLRFDHDDGPELRQRMRMNAFGANWRSRWLGLPFGDQGLTLPKSVFERLDGFDETMPYGEDFALAWRARRGGLPLRELPAFLATSPRKYVERGWLRTTTRHLRLTAALVWREARR